MANRTIEAIMRLSAKLGSLSAFDRMAGKLDGIDRKAKAFNRSQGMMAQGAGLAARRIAGAFAAAAVVRGGAALVTNFAAVERRLNRIAINADASKETLTTMFRTVDRAASDYAMTQDSVTDGLEALVASGRNLEDAMAFLPSVAATAQATGSDIVDIATTADAVASSLGIAAGNMQRAFDILVKSGKQGKFELKDMAQYVPTLAPAFAALGYKGEEGLKKLASMLQTVRLRTGSASEAATALQNVIQKLESQETVKRFAEFGVDLRKELEKARKEGRDLVEVFIDLTEKATKGDLSKIPQLFGDAQMQVGMRALVQGRDAFHGFVTDLQNVDGSTIADLNKVLSDSQAKIDKMANAWERLQRTIGAGIAEPAGGAMDFVSSNMDKAQFINQQLEKEGMSYWERRMWWARNGFDNHDQGMKAFAGGWRSPEGLLAAKGPMSASPELPSRRQDGASGPPVPTPRPVPLSVTDQYALYGRGHAAAARNDSYRQPPPSRLERGNAIGALMGGGDANYDEFVRAARTSATEIANGGDQAGQSISEAARSINEAGQQAGSTFKAMVDGVGRQIGADMAASFKANVGSVTVNARVSGAPLANADTGVSRAGGPR